MQEPIIGIDLGTTNSEVALPTDATIEMLEENGTPIMPSYVGLSPENQLLVGMEARNQYVLYPERTIRSIKRKMGTNEYVPLGDQSYLPQEISAMILKQLKARAEKRLGRPVHKAVITVPAQFSDAQRQATRDAGSIAGLEVVRIINEPTAACLAYEHAEPNERRNVLAFDLGGGTFDVSIVHMEGDLVEVISSHGDNHLGGDDMDAAITDWLLRQVNEKLTPLAEHRLKRAAEEAKIHLTDHPYVKVIENQLPTQAGGEVDLVCELERHEFNEMIQKLLDKTITAVHQALADAQLRTSQIDEVVLVGGATRIPIVHEILERELGKSPRRDVHPDLAVAYGAGIMAARVMGRTDQRILVDITPYTFGTSAIGMHDGVMSHNLFVPLIKAGSPLPISKTENFYTIVDNQKSVDVRIFQGEDHNACRNIFIGNFIVEGLANVPAGNDFLVTMNLDLDGILTVTAVEKDTGLSKEVKIEDALAKMTEEQMCEAREALNKLFGDKINLNFIDTEEVDEDKDKDKDTATVAQSYEEFQKRVAHKRDQMDDVDRQDADNLLAKLKAALEEKDRDTIAQASTELEDLLFYMEVD